MGLARVWEVLDGNGLLPTDSRMHPGRTGLPAEVSREVSADVTRNALRGESENMGEKETGTGTGIETESEAVSGGRSESAGEAGPRGAIASRRGTGMATVHGDALARENASVSVATEAGEGEGSRERRPAFLRGRYPR